MRAFARLVLALDGAPDNAARLRAWQCHLASVPAEDAAWALHLLLGHTPGRLVTAADLRAAVLQDAPMDEWLLDACLQRTGDLSETVALVLPPPRNPSALSLAHWMNERVLPLRRLPAARRPQVWRSWLIELEADARWTLLRLLTGTLRPRVCATVLQDGLAAATGSTRALMALRLQDWPDRDGRPDEQALRAVLEPPDPRHGAELTPADLTALTVKDIDWPQEDAPLARTLGQVHDWSLQWRFGGPELQFIWRGGRMALWSPGPELVNDRLEALVDALAWLPDDTHLLGQLEAPAGGPSTFLAHDALHLAGENLRHLRLSERLDRLRVLVAAAPDPTRFTMAQTLLAVDWSAVQAGSSAGRAMGAAGLVLRRHDGSADASRQAQGGGSQRWRLPPWRLHGVLVHAEWGPGGQSLVSCSLALWNRRPLDAEEVQTVLARREPAGEGLQLVTFTKLPVDAASQAGQDLARCVRATALERFGPVRSVRPSLVCSVAFDRALSSRRHRCGAALSGARLEALWPSHALQQADDLDALRACL